MKNHAFFALLLAVVGIMSGLCLKDAQSTAVAAEMENIRSGFLYLSDIPIN